MNLCLAVAEAEPAGAARAGWHRIASWFHAVDLWDDVYVERSVDGTTSFEREVAADAPRKGVIDWPLEKDLAFCALKLLEDVSGEQLAVKVRIRKRIPSGGGLGGGSSNAATMLRTVNSLFGLGIEPEELMRLSQKLGSDVAFFMDGELDGSPRPAIVRGFGESVERVDRVRGSVKLILPEFGCPTDKVYRMFDAIVRRGSWSFRDGDVEQVARAAITRGFINEQELFNDLTAAAASLEPRLERIMQSVQKTGAHPILSGSGSTMFVVHEDEKELVLPSSIVCYRSRLV